MNFEVFVDGTLWAARASELRLCGYTVIADFNGRSYTIKWEE